MTPEQLATIETITRNYPTVVLSRLADALRLTELFKNVPRDDLIMALARAAWNHV